MYEDTRLAMRLKHSRFDIVGGADADRFSIDRGAKQLNFIKNRASNVLTGTHGCWHEAVDCYYMYG